MTLKKLALAFAAAAAMAVTGVAGILPDGYIQLESVSSTKGGGQYIKTGVYPEKDKTTSVEIKYQYLTVAIENWLFGYWEGLGNPNYGTAIGIGNNGGVATDRLRVGVTGGFYGPSNTNVHELWFNTSDGTFRDDRTSELSPALKNATEPLPSVPDADHEYYLFGRNTRTSGVHEHSEWSVHATIFYCKIFVGGKLKRDYVPALRTSDSVAGLYDLAEGGFYPTDHGDPLVAGQIVPMTVGDIADSVWISESDGPHPTVSGEGGATLSEGQDYTLSWMRSDDHLTGEVIVTGIGNYAGVTVRKTYRLVLDLPAEYELLDRVMTTRKADQWIATGVFHESNAQPTLETKFRFRTTPNDIWFFGYWDSDVGYGTAIGTSNNGSTLSWRYRVGSAVSGYYGAASTSVQTMLFNGDDGTFVNGALVEGTPIAGAREPEATEEIRSHHEYTILGRSLYQNGASVAPTPMEVDFYYARLSINGELRRDYVPARRLTDGKIGLYDLKNRVFQAPKGASGLEAGDVVERVHYQIGDVGVSKWTSEQDGPRPLIYDLGGQLLTEGVDYTLRWKQALGGLTGFVLITGQGAHTGYNATKSYELARSIPVLYRPHEYLETRNGAYVKTGLLPEPGKAIQVTLRYRYLGLATSDAWTFGYYDDASAVGTQIGMCQNSNHANKLEYLLRVGSTSVFHDGLDTNQDHTLDLNAPDGTTLDGQEISGGVLADQKETGAAVAEHEYYLFRRNLNGSADSHTAPIRIYSCCISVGGEEKRDYVAVTRLSDSAYGFYDHVTGTFVKTAADEDFTIGPEIPCAYYQIAEPESKPWVSPTEGGPKPEIRNAKGELLVEGRDYTLTWLRTEGTYDGYVQVTGIGAYEGRNAVRHYDIEPAESEFVRVKYLESSGSEIVRTGLGVRQGEVLSLEAKLRVCSPSSDYAYLIGAAPTRSVPGGCTVGLSSQGVRVRVYECVQEYDVSTEEPLKVRVNTPTGTYVNEHCINAEMASLPADLDIPEVRAFGVLSENGREYPTSCRIYSLKMWVNGVLKRDLIPGYFEFGRQNPGLYDRVEHKFYPNVSGAGALAYYQPVRYVEADGHQCVKTGIFPSKDRPKTTARLDFQYTVCKNETWLWGYWDAGRVYGSTFGMNNNASAGNVLQFRARLGQKGAYLAPADTARHVVVINGADGTLFEGEKVVSTEVKDAVEPDDGAQGGHEYFLFKRNYAATDCASVRLFSCKMWQNDELVADLMPVREVISGKVGLYDEVRTRFLPSETGTDLKSLVAGPDIYESGLMIILR